jgi:hypothetical protein
LPLSLFSFALPFPPSWTLVAHSYNNLLHFFLSFYVSLHCFNLWFHKFTLTTMSSSFSARQNKSQLKQPCYQLDHKTCMPSCQHLN